MTTSPRVGPLFTDLYELTMAAAYLEHQVAADATFSLYIRASEKRNYFAAAGLADALHELEELRFSDSDIHYLKETGFFSKEFLSYLKQFRFSGTVYAMPEGTIFFPDEPLAEVTAPIIEAQIIETFLLNTIGFQTLVTSKAARCIHAAGGRPLIDFSLRRTQGQDAGLKVARSSFIAGFSATSNVLAGKIYGIPVSGTMAHSFISTFDDESEAFAAFSDTFPENAVFLIDTYDTLEGARNTVNIAKKLREKGKSVIGVRLDSGDIAVLSQKVREILDAAGLHEIKIFASSSFDEFKIADVLEKGGRIDAFGVGTKMGVSADLPYLDIVYKLVRFKDREVRKLSPGKITLAGEKQVFRKTDRQGRYLSDTIGLRDDRVDDSLPLLEKVMQNGKLTLPPVALTDIRDRFAKNFSLLDEKYKSIEACLVYPVQLSARLEELQKRV
ncbi:nicotinate phosphoribosyltransferase [Thermodesulfobacteriota bacterium]